MKFEMFEKVGEIVVAELRPANVNNAIATQESARKAEELRIKQEKEEAENKAQSAKALANIVEAINKRAEQGHCSLRFEWKESKRTCNGVTDTEWLLYSKYFVPILESAGYTVNIPHWYCQSWVTRSGKIGYTTISW